VPGGCWSLGDWFCGGGAASGFGAAGGIVSEPGGGRTGAGETGGGNTGGGNTGGGKTEGGAVGGATAGGAACCASDAEAAAAKASAIHDLRMLGVTTPVQSSPAGGRRAPASRFGARTPINRSAPMDGQAKPRRTYDGTERRRGFAPPRFGLAGRIDYIRRRTPKAGRMFSLADRPMLKMNGLGNEIVVLDLRGADHVVAPAEARAIGGTPGLRFDQLMVLHAPRSAETEAFVSIYNIDGSEAGACGNGTRCVAWALNRETGRERFAVETAAGRLDCEKLGPQHYRIDMGRPRFGWRDIPIAHETADTARIWIDAAGLGASLPNDFAGASMGNPHAVFFVEDVEAHDLARVGPLLETHALFPERANISLAAVTSRRSLTLKVWERGAGLTRACGSGACAAAVSAHRRGLTDRQVRVALPGGDLDIDWRADDSVTMAGGVTFEFEARLDPAAFAAAA